MPLVNKQFPGPLIEVNGDDTIVVCQQPGYELHLGALAWHLPEGQSPHGRHGRHQTVPDRIL